MSELLFEYVMAVYHIASMMGIYLILGLFAAGLLHELLPEDAIRKKLGKRGSGSILKGALYGLPLPMCSCSVLPFAASLKRSGASKGAVGSFFISTPMTGIDSLALTYGVFGWIFALLRALSSLLSAMLFGLFADRAKEESMQVAQEGGCCSAGSCCAGTEELEPKSRKSINAVIKGAFAYAYGPLLNDIAKPMFYGLLGAGAVFLLLPHLESLASLPLFAGYLLLLLVSLPVYVCSVSAIPIAYSLLLAGFSPGSAFLFLSAAPATNLMTLGVAAKIFGKGLIGAYLLSISLVTLLFSYLIDLFMSRDAFPLLMAEGEGEESLLYGLFGIALIVLLVYKLLPLKKN